MQKLRFATFAFILALLVNPLVAGSYGKGQLQEEQRIIGSYIHEADKNVERAVSRIRASLPDTARLSVFRAVRDMSRAEGIMQNHPRHIQELASSIFLDERKVRAELQESYDKLDNKFSELENDLYTLIDEFDRNMGLTGKSNSLRNQVNRYRTLYKASTDETRSQAERDEAAAKIDDIQKAIDSGDEKEVARQAELIDDKGGSTGGSTGGTTGGNGVGINDQTSTSGTSGGTMGGNSSTGGTPGVSTSTETPAGATSPVSVTTTTSQTPDGGTKTVKDYEVYTDKDGNQVKLTQETVVNPDGSKSVTTRKHITNPTTGEECDEISVQKFDPQGRPVGGPASQVECKGANGKVTIKVTTADGRVYALGDGSSPVDSRATYAGGEGNLLLSEAEYELTYSRDDSGRITNVEERPGRQRDWDFRVGEDEAERIFSDDFAQMTTVLRFGDAKGKKNFTITGWKVMAPDGSMLFQAGGENEVKVTFPATGEYTVEVRGMTDWSAPFRISQPLQINLN